MSVIRELSLHIERLYVVAKLKKFYEAFLKKFAQNNKNLFKKYNIRVYSVTKKQFKKAELVEFYACILANKEVFQAMLKELPAPIPELVEQAVWGIGFTDTQIEEKYKTTILDVKRGTQVYGKDYEELDGIYCLFQDISTHRQFWYMPESRSGARYTHTLYLDRELANFVRDYITKPREYDLHPVEENAIEPELKRFEGEKAIFQDIPIVDAYIQQGQLKVSSSGKPVDSSLNKLRKLCAIPEFFEDEKDRVLGCYRTHFLAASPLMFEGSSIIHSGLRAIERFYKLYIQGTLTPEYFLKKLKGWHHIYHRETIFTKTLAKVLQALPVNQWISSENLEKYILYRGFADNLFVYGGDMHYVSFAIKYTTNAGYAMTDKIYVNGRNYKDLVWYPFLLSNWACLAAWGILEVAYEKPGKVDIDGGNADYISPGDGIRYVRLTSLGAYILGKKSEYAPPEQEESSVTLDEEYLLLRYHGNKLSLLNLVESIAVKLDDNFYKVSFESVLGKCQSVADVEMQINLFQQLLSDNPPVIWKDFFKELQKKAYYLQSEEEYKIYQLPDNQELIRLIVKDELLKKHVIRAENYMILIRKKELSKVKNKLKKKGFLIEFS